MHSFVTSLHSLGPSLALACLLFPFLTLAGGAQELTDPPETLRVEQLLDERQDDQVEATALYVHGRVLRDRGDFPDALGRFQRAWRFNPHLVSVMEDIVPLAVSLKRNAEVTAYVLLAADTPDIPIDLLQRMASLLVQQERFADALRLNQCYLDRREIASEDGLNPENVEDVVALFEVGRLALLVGEFHRSADAFAAIQDVLADRTKVKLTGAQRERLWNKPELVYALIGESFFRDGRWDDAEAMFRKSHDTKGDPGMLGFRLARIEQARMHRDRALKELEHYFTAKTESAGMAPYRLLADLMDGVPDVTSNNRPDLKTPAKTPSSSLLDKLRQLAATNPDDPSLGYFLADQLRAADRLDEAETLYKKLLKESPAAEAFEGLVDLYLSRRQVRPLLEQLGATVAKSDSLAVLGTQLSRIASDHEMVDQLSNAVQAMIADPEEPLPSGTSMAMAILHAQAGQWERCGASFNIAMAGTESNRGPFAIEFAFKMFELEQPRRAAKVLQQVLDGQLLPDKTSELSYYISGAWTLAKEPQKALDAARQAARLEPLSSRTVSRVAWVQYQAQQLSDAENAYIELLGQFDSDFKSDENRQVMRDARLVLATINVQQNRLESAEQWLLQVLDEFPEDIGALNDLGYLWVDQGKHLERSLVMAQKAVDAQPDNVAYRDSLGWALFRLGKYDQAVRELRKATATELTDGVILDHLGDALFKAGQRNQANEAWQKAIKVFQKEKNQQELEKTRAKLEQHAQEAGTSDVKERSKN